MAKSNLFSNGGPFTVSRETLSRIFPETTVAVLRVLTGDPDISEEQVNYTLHPKHLIDLESALGSGKTEIQKGRRGKGAYSLQGITRK